MGKAVWVWLIFMAIVFTLLSIDLGVFHRKAHKPSIKESLTSTICYILIASAYGAWIWDSFGQQKAMEFYTGYAMELSLSFDNVFVISLIFSALSIPSLYQHRVLFWGIIGVLVMRGVMISLGAALISQFSWVLLIFGVFLLITGVKMLIHHAQESDLENNKILKWMRKHMLITPELHGQKFFVLQDMILKEGQMAKEGKPIKKVIWVTPLFVSLILVEIADLVFAVDSVPAIFAVTQDPFIVYTSNIFAILGLRSLYFTLESMVNRFKYLSKALALVLIFIGGKILAHEGFHIKIATEISLTVVLTLIISGIVVSLIATRNKNNVKEIPKSH